MRNNYIEVEFYDNDFVVLMMTPQNSDVDFQRLTDVFTKYQPKEIIGKENISVFCPERMMSVRKAVFSDCEIIDVDAAVGRVCAELTVSCPPAVPIVVSGEFITAETVALLKYNGISGIKVVKEK